MNINLLRRVKFIVDSLYWLFKLLTESTGAVSNWIQDYLDYAKQNEKRQKKDDSKRKGSDG